MTRPSRIADGLLFAAVFTVTFAKLQWEVAGTLSLSDVLTALFLVAFAATRLAHRDGRLARGALVALGFFCLFLLVYLAGFFALDTGQALAQWAKGMVKFLLHFLFLVAAVATLARRSERFSWAALGTFCGGLVFNALYGVVQLALAETTGANLDQSLLSPLTGGASSINVYGAIEGASVYRPNALTGDPNHLGIELAIPLLLLTRSTSAWRAGTGCGCRSPSSWVPAARRAGDALAQRPARTGRGSSSCLPYWRSRTGRFLAPPRAWPSPSRRHPRGSTSSSACCARAWTRRQRDGDAIHRLRLRPRRSRAAALRARPEQLLVYYEFVTGRTNFGPHSFYVALVVETGVVGTALFAGFVWYLFRRLGATRRIGRALQAARDPAAARVRPLAWGLTAALVGTVAANAFYLTMQFYYFYVFAMLALAAPIVFGRRLKAG